MWWVACCAAALSTDGGAAGGGGRETVSFNFGWRFISGDPPGAAAPCPASAFKNTTPGLRCANQVFAPLMRVGDCQRACCPSSPYINASASGCTSFQFVTSKDPGHWKENVTAGCYLGVGPPDSCDAAGGATPSSIQFLGGRVDAPVLPPPSGTWAAYSAAGADDSAWRAVDVPHDFVVARRFSPAEDDGGAHGYLPRAEPGWYRKHFALPPAWAAEDPASSVVWLRFNGVFHISSIWLDGAPLTPSEGFDTGYTAFEVRLPAAAADGGAHVLAMRVDASYGSGHWYEGGGIYRDVQLVRAPAVHLVPDGLFASAAASSESGEDVVSATAEVANDGVVAALLANFSVWDAEGALVATATSAPAELGAGATAVLAPATPLLVAGARRWTPQSPYLYTVGVSLLGGGGGGDALNVSTGFRTARFMADRGFVFEGEKLALRGFCNHNDMAGVGAAVPQRLNLYRAQMLRGVGGNTWRMSHNPGDPATFDVLDRLGVLSWDENRDYSYNSVGGMRQMVRRDRNHPSVIVWSMCNEIECTELTPAVGAAYRAAALAQDPTRPLSGNLLHDSSGSMPQHFDVVGISHGSTVPAPYTPSPASWYDPRYGYAWLHENHPGMAFVGSESSSCLSQRGVNVVDTSGASPSFDDVHSADCLSKHYCPPNTTKAQDEVLGNGSVAHHPGACTQSWTLAYDDGGEPLEFFGGQLGVWTLFDYLGEPSSHQHGAAADWPQVSSNFGAFDLAGFAKPAAWFYRSWWLAHIAADSNARPPIAGAAAVVKIVHEWREPAPPLIAVYSNLPVVELFLDGTSLGRRSMGWANWTEWPAPRPFAPGNLTAVGYAAGVGAGSGGGQLPQLQAVARDSSLTPGAAVAIALSLDAPALSTGTGEALLLDGADTGLVRCSIVDARGVLSSAAAVGPNITFAVISGPGRVIGVGNGNPSCHEPNKASSRTAHHGLARAVVQVSVNAATPDRALQALVDLEGNHTTRVELAPYAGPTAIVVQASAPGFAPATISIPVSVDAAKDGVLAVAARSVHVAIAID